MSENCFGRLSSVNKNLPSRHKTVIICNKAGIIPLLAYESAVIPMIV